MPCLVCASANEVEFNSEMNIHFRGLANIDNPGVLLFPKLLVCLDCGSSRFATPSAELLRLASGAAIDKHLACNHSADGCSLG